ncbi:MAG TPA: maltotransferase domain-containing protein [Candidatus Solibacter sp.]|nr:maltotransferase domain-containing protein [Candidatus Solibacter sp.]
MTLPVAIEHVHPAVDGGRFAGKGTAGLPLEISADIFSTGHDELLAWTTLEARAPSKGAARGSRKGSTTRSGEVLTSPMSHSGNDRWVGHATPGSVGAWQLSVFGMVDRFGTWLRDLRIRHEAGQELELELEEGRLMVEARMRRRGLGLKDQAELETLAASLSPARDVKARYRAATAARAGVLMQRTLDRSTAGTAGPFPIWVDRERAGFSAWYEMFPRSEGAAGGRSGTFKTAARRLPAIAGMGFDIVYLPPVHPIGSSHRKGANNTLDAGPDDVGSPWAIGSRDGGHTAVHPDLGGIDDFDAFVAAAGKAGLEVALDFAVQCSPDHPWVTEHPEWFRHRPDGSIRYAENPPKRYQDIYPIDFETEDREGLWQGLRDVVDFWIGHGVRVFRVDNPHTKSFDFWEWLIEGVHQSSPDVIFLSEAFTRPRVMERLAKVGFTQSYTYFTWRNTKWELSEYLTELSRGESVDYMRPNFWVNTPDILHEYLQRGGPPAFAVRLVLAALTCASWGMYSGYELYENTPVREGSEEYLHSEKYELRPRDWKTKATLAPMITRVNKIRREHREAIALMRTLRLQHVDKDEIICVSRQNQQRDDTLIVIVNLDPVGVAEASVWLDFAGLGLTASKFEAVDLLSGKTYKWTAGGNYVRLDPAVTPAHVLTVKGAD